jgi:DNA-binding NtrC family response regulator
LGCGSVFSLYFPLLEEVTEKADAVDEPLASSRKATIMLVEDEEMVSNMVSRILDSFGHKVIVCKDGKDALELYRNTWKSIDLVILDLVMPKMSGKDTFQAMKLINPKVKVLLASGFSIDGEAQSVLKLGATGFIQKPFNMNDLSKSITDCLDSGKGNG